MQADEDTNLDNCVLCGLGGALICCDGCPAAVHLRCVGETAKSIPEGEWLCAECRMGSRGAHRLKSRAHPALYFELSAEPY